MVGPYINLKYTTKDGDGQFKGTEIFFYKPMTLTAYHPFVGEEGKVPGLDGIIEANTRPENQEPDKQPDIDFLWDSKTGVDKKDFSASDPNVSFTFAHKMSKLSFTFLSSEPFYDENDRSIMLSDGVDVRTMVSYEIEGLGVEGTFNTADGVCAINDTREGITITCEKITVDNEVNKYDYEREFSPLIVFPQKKPDDKNFILHITTDELKEEGSPTQSYKCALQFTDNEIKPGCHYKFTIKVTRLGLIVGKLTIEPWVLESEKFIIATIDGDQGFKEQSAETPATGNQ